MRPTGVTLIAIYHFLAAACLLLAACAIVVGGSLLGAFLGRNLDTHVGGASLGFLIGVVGAMVFFGFAAIAAIAGYGMWTMRGWGRILTIVLAAISLLAALPGFLIRAPLHLFGGFFFGGFGLIRIAISGLIIWYLVQPQVVALFRTQGAVPQASR